MKRIFTSLLLVLAGLFMFATLSVQPVKAETDLIDLYPNEDVNNLKGNFGNSNWVLDFAGYRYHTVSFMARFASNFDGIEEKAEFKGSEIGHLSANAMGGIIHNDTEKDVVLKDGDRTALTAVINRVWAVFDEEGKLVLFEDHINVYYMTEVAGEDYFRLSTPEEIALFDEAEEGEKPANIRQTHIRIALNEDGETYKAEPLGYLKWTNADYVPESEGVEEEGVPSVIFEHDVNEVHLNAGWTALHFSTWDRGKPNFNALIALMPGLLASQEEKMELNYLNPAPYFVNLSEKDVNKSEPGINFVYDYETTPVVSMLIDEVEARHVNDEQFKKGQFSLVDFVLKLYDEENELLETINVTYDAEEKEYVPEKEVFEQLDTSLFGARYYVVFEATQLPMEGFETSSVTGPKVIENTIVDIGVLPIHFTGVENRYLDEGLPIDLLEGIKAYDNSRDLKGINDTLSYEIVNEKTNSSHFNIWNAKAGTYRVTVKAYLDFVQAIDISEDVEISFGEYEGTITKERINISVDPFGYASPPPPMAMFTEFTESTRTLLKTSDLKYNVQMALIDGSGIVVAYFNTVSGKMRVEGGAETTIAGNNREPSRSTWIDAIDFGVGYKLIAGYAPADDVHVLLQKVNVGDKIEGLGFAARVHGETTYRLTVADFTPPKVVVRAETLEIYTDTAFVDAEEAILSNIVIFEEYGYTVAMPGANRIDITEPGEHNVRVIVTDDSLNEVEVNFTLLVKPAKLSEEEVNAIIADLEDRIRDLEEQNGTGTSPSTGCQSAINSATPIFVILSVLLGTFVVVFLKKRK